MSGDDFRAWLAAMKAKGFNKQEAGLLIGRGAVWVSRAQNEGTDLMAALACAAVLKGLKPFKAATTERAA